MKSIIKNILKNLDFDLHRVSLQNRKDDPIYVSTKLFNPLKVKCVIDGGASIGTITQRLSNSFQNSQIHAFEPFDPHFDQLQRIADKNSRITPVKKALSDKEGKVTFFLNTETGTNSILQSTENGRSIYGDQLKEIGQTHVECISLDQYLKLNKIDSVDILKLDLQGSELAALNGTSKSLSAGKIKCVLCEIMFETHYKNQPSAGKILNYLIDQFDFSLFNFYQLHYHHGKLIYADAILIHSSILNEVKGKIKKDFHPFSNLPIFR